jgi:hypothetical protein
MMGHKVLAHKIERPARQPTAHDEQQVVGGVNTASGGGNSHFCNIERYFRITRMVAYKILESYFRHHGIRSKTILNSPISFSSDIFSFRYSPT